MDLGYCPFCTESYEGSLVKNSYHRHGYYCSNCHDQYRADNLEYLAKCKLSRDAKKHFFLIMTDVFTCRHCKEEKSIQNDSIWNRRGHGYVACCKDCYKLNKTTGGKSEEELKEYHRRSTAEYCKRTGNQSQKEWYKRASESLSDGYIKICIRAELRQKKIKGISITAEMIAAKRIVLQLKRSTSQTSYKGNQNA